MTSDTSFHFGEITIETAGDLDTTPEIIIEDPGASDMERLFGSDPES
jgi:hypothetical protein